MAMQKQGPPDDGDDVGEPEPPEVVVGEGPGVCHQTPQVHRQPNSL